MRSQGDSWGALLSASRTRKGPDMTRVLVDPDLRRKLLDLRQPLELHDESGRVVGRVIPIVDPSTVASAQPPLSEEELQRREQEPDYSTAEVLTYLEKL